MLFFSLQKKNPFILFSFQPNMRNFRKELCYADGRTEFLHIVTIVHLKHCSLSSPCTIQAVVADQNSSELFYTDSKFTARRKCIVILCSQELELFHTEKYFIACTLYWLGKSVSSDESSFLALFHKCRYIVCQAKTVIRWHHGCACTGFLPLWMAYKQYIIELYNILRMYMFPNLL